ncbi:MAG: transporter [Bacteroidota bacterium]
MSEYMVTNQPGVYIGPQTVFPGNAIVEMNLLGYAARFDFPFQSYTHPSLLARYGVLDWLEIRASSSLSTTRLSIADITTSSTRISGFNVGAQALLIGAGKKLPMTSLQFNLSFPNNGRISSIRQFVVPQLWLTTQIPLSPVFNAYVNAIGTYYSATEVFQFQYVLAFDYAIMERLTAFVEHTGIPRRFWGIEHGYNLGLVYALSRHLQVDLSGGFSSLVSNWTGNANLGFSFRLAPKRNL